MGNDTSHNQCSYVPSFQWQSILDGVWSGIISVCFCSLQTTLILKNLLIPGSPNYIPQQWCERTITFSSNPWSDKKRTLEWKDMNPVHVLNDEDQRQKSSECLPDFKIIVHPQCCWGIFKSLSLHSWLSCSLINNFHLFLVSQEYKCSFLSFLPPSFARSHA